MPVAERLQIRPRQPQIAIVTNRDDVVRDVRQARLEPLLFAKPAKRVLPPVSGRQFLPDVIVSALRRLLTKSAFTNFPAANCRKLEASEARGLLHMAHSRMCRSICGSNGRFQKLFDNHSAFSIYFTAISHWNGRFTFNLFLTFFPFAYVNPAYQGRVSQTVMPTRRDLSMWTVPYAPVSSIA